MITDDGRGFDARSLKRNVGLYSMVERARLVNGIVTTDSSVGRGTTVRAIVPRTTADQPDA
jgi:signal transduction histidine kinase